MGRFLLCIDFDQLYCNPADHILVLKVGLSER